MLPGPGYTFGKSCLGNAVRRYATRRPPIPEGGFQYLENAEIDLTSMNPDEAAEYHFAERADVMHRGLAITGILASRDFLPLTSSAQIVPAVLQISHGSKAMETQAAHVGMTFTVDNKFLYDYPLNVMAREAVKAMLTQTHIVRTYMNEVDSFLERKILKRSFEIYLNNAIRQFYGFERELAPELEMFLRACHQDLAKRCRNVIEQKLLELKGRSVSSKERDKIVVLEAYYEVLSPDNLPLSTSKGYIEAILPVFD